MLDHCYNSYHFVTSLNKLRLGTAIRQGGVFLKLGFVSFLHVSTISSCKSSDDVCVRADFCDTEINKYSHQFSMQGHVCILHYRKYIVHANTGKKERFSAPKVGLVPSMDIREKHRVI